MRKLTTLFRRSPAELRFRLRQEAANLWLWKYPPRPRLAIPASPLPGLSLPLPPVSTGTLEERILAHEFPLLGLTIATGPAINWRQDYVSGRQTGLDYFRAIPYLDASRAGDHKVIWELNRHQHLVVLAQRGRPEDLCEIATQLSSWLAQNPFQCGINWASALEVAFRALSWLSIWHLCGPRLPASLHEPWLQSLYHHGLHLEYNLSVYFSPNTHLLGEAVALYALGRLLPQWPRAQRWARLGGDWVRRQYETQVRPDGSHFEQSSYYHVYALDFFLLFSRLSGEGNPAIPRMAGFLNALLGPSGRIFLIGDDDGGRLFHPYGDHAAYGQQTLADAGYLDAPRSACFPDAGLVSWVDGSRHVLFDAGPFGGGSAGHSHADTLQILVRQGAQAILTDPGTYTYVGDPAARDRFRGTAMHNTLRLDERDQAEPADPFRWNNPPEVVLEEYSPVAAQALCRSRDGRQHRRRLAFEDEGRSLFVLDTTLGCRSVERFWHPGLDPEPAGPLRWRLGPSAWLLLDQPAERIPSLRSPALGASQPAASLLSRHPGETPLAAALWFAEECPYQGVRCGATKIEWITI
jgi:hypothetical protein